MSKIAGIVTTGVAEMDARYLRITLNSAQRLLQSDRITNLVVGLDSTANTDAIYAALVPRLGGLPQQMTLKKWIDLATYYKQVRTLFNGIFLFMGLIVFFMVLMSSVNTLLMTMFERTREIGAMLAMGTPRSWIVALFMTEATLSEFWVRSPESSWAICWACSSTYPDCICRRRPAIPSTFHSLSSTCPAS
jgi:putative ABC transport system permease protein